MSTLTQAQTAVTNAQNALTNAQTALTGTAAQIKSLTGQLGQGSVRYLEDSGPNWDAWTTSGDPAKQDWMRKNVQRFVSFTPFFADKLAWYQNAFCYFDSYAIYVQINGQPNPIAAQHPEWILRDSAGNPLYIPWGCSGGKCPQYAGDVSNQAFRDYQIAQMKAALIPGWKGLFLDDVNMSLNACDANGSPAIPFGMNDAMWKSGFATYVEQIRAAFPNLEILHNSIWFAGDAYNPQIKRQWLAADLINIERGFGDTGIGGGTGPWSLAALMNFIDGVHAAGRSVVIGDYTMDFQQYSLACYFLIHDGFDYWGINAQTPDNWSPALYSLNLGPAINNRYKWNNTSVLRRDFRGGSVFVNEPNAAAVTVKFPTPMYDENNVAMNMLTLGGKAGKVLRK